MVNKKKGTHKEHPKKQQQHQQNYTKRPVTVANYECERIEEEIVREREETTAEKQRTGNEAMSPHTECVNRCSRFHDCCNHSS